MSDESYIIKYLLFIIIRADKLYTLENLFNVYAVIPYKLSKYALKQAQPIIYIDKNMSDW